MPFYTEQLRTSTIETHIDFAGQRLDFSFDPNALRKEWYDKQARGLRQEDLDILLDCMLETVSEWDVLDEQEEQVPLERDAIKAMNYPIPLFGKITNQIQTAANDGGDTVKKRR